MLLENFMSCNASKVGKLAREAYMTLLKRLESCDKPWFGTAHTWDAGARNEHFLLCPPYL